MSNPLQNFAKTVIKQSIPNLEIINEMIDLVAKDETLFPENFIEQLNIYAHCTLTNLNLALVLKNATQAENLYEEVFFIRNLYLFIYEAIKNIDKFNITFNALANNDDDYKKRHKQYAKDLKAFKKEYYNEKMRLIRNETVAHIPEDYKTYKNIIDKVDIDYSLKMAFLFLEIISKLANNLSFYLNNNKNTNTSNIDAKSFNQEKILMLLKKLNAR